MDSLESGETSPNQDERKSDISFVAGVRLQLGSRDHRQTAGLNSTSTRDNLILTNMSPIV